MTLSNPSCLINHLNYMCKTIIFNLLAFRKFGTIALILINCLHLTISVKCQNISESKIYLGYGYDLVSDIDSVYFKLNNQSLFELDTADHNFFINESFNYLSSNGKIKYYTNGIYLYDSLHNIVGSDSVRYNSFSSNCYLETGQSQDVLNTYATGQEAGNTGCLKYEYNNGTSSNIFNSINSEFKIGEQIKIIKSDNSNGFSFFTPKIYSDSILFYKRTSSNEYRNYISTNYLFTEKVGDGIGKTAFTENGDAMVMTCFSGHIFFANSNLNTGQLTNLRHLDLEENRLHPYGACIKNDTAYIGCLNDSSVVIMIFDMSNNFNLIDSFSLPPQLNYYESATNLTILDEKLVIYSDEFFTWYKIGISAEQRTLDCINNLREKPVYFKKSMALPESIFRASNPLAFTITHNETDLYQLAPNSAIANYKSFEWIIDNDRKIENHSNLSPIVKLNPGKNRISLIGKLDNNKFDSVTLSLFIPDDKKLFHLDTTICAGHPLVIDDVYVFDHYGFNPNDELVINTSGNYQISSTDLASSIELSVDVKLCKANVPNVFTPNGDGVNDVFVPVSNKLLEFLPNIISYKLIIIDKTNKVVFTSDRFEDNWNGTFNGKALESDVYIYKILINYQSTIETINGDITLIK